MKYADKQLRQRAYTIAHTERAMAYEYGRYQHTKDLIEEGYLPMQQKVWSAAGNESACERCRYLDGQAVPMDGYFTEANGNQVFLPTLHPRCRCCARYEDVKEKEWLNSIEGIKQRMSLQLYKLSPEEVETLRTYTGFSATRVNAAIYSENENRINKEKRFIQVLDEALSKGKRLIK